MPTFTHGKNAAFKIDDSGGTLRDISDVLTDVSISRTADVAEVSAFSNSSKAFVSGLKDATLTISGSFFFFGISLDLLQKTSWSTSIILSLIYPPASGRIVLDL